MKKALLIFAVLSLLVLGACQQSQQAPTNNQPDSQEQQQEDEMFPTTGGASIQFENVPQGPFMSGETYEFRWRAVGGTSITDSHVESSYSQDFSNSQQSTMSNNGPGIYSGSLTFDTESERTVYIRASAVIDGQEVSTETVTRTVQPSDTETTTDSETDSQEEENMSDSDSTESNVQTIEMTARQFEFEPSQFTVKRDVPVRIVATSTDVDHGISIPSFGVSQTLPANEEVVIEFTPDETGEFSFFCNVFCGSGHSSMNGKMIVEE